MFRFSSIDFKIRFSPFHILSLETCYFYRHTQQQLEINSSTDEWIASGIHNIFRLVPFGCIELWADVLLGEKGAPQDNSKICGWSFMNN